MIVAPLRADSTVLGALVVASRPGRRQFGPETVQLVGAFADHASIVLAYARAQRQGRRLATLEGRERIARDLHDGIVQSLFGVGVQLQSAAEQAEPAIERLVKDAVGGIDHLIYDVRKYIDQTRPTAHSGEQLAEAVEDLADHVAKATSIAVHCQVDERAAAPLSERSADVLQLVREALTNVVRHSEARNVWIILERANNQAILTIRDDGNGFNADAVSPGGGLTHIQERAHDAGGEVSVLTRPAAGTTIHVSLPLRYRSAKAGNR
jgi:signal transduction histidine kinase